MNSQAIIEEIKRLNNDPLGKIFIQTWEVNQGQIRWVGGNVQVRPTNSKYFSFGEDADDFLKSLESELK